MVTKLICQFFSLDKCLPFPVKFCGIRDTQGALLRSLKEKTSSDENSTWTEHVLPSLPERKQERDRER
jgi:hypothetical protein